jgi:hypothetical protein
MSPSTLAGRRARRLVRTDRTPSNRVPTDRAPADRRCAHRSRTRPGARDRLRRLLGDDAGMSTVEYAIGCVAAAAFAAVLYAVVSGDSVVTALTQLVQRALTAGF